MKDLSGSIYCKTVCFAYDPVQSVLTICGQPTDACTARSAGLF